MLAASSSSCCSVIRRIDIQRPSSSRPTSGSVLGTLDVPARAQVGSRSRRRGFAIAAALALTVAVGAAAVAYRSSERRLWVREQATPQIVKLAAEDKGVEAFQLIEEAETVRSRRSRPRARRCIGYSRGHGALDAAGGARRDRGLPLTRESVAAAWYHPARQDSSAGRLSSMEGFETWRRRVALGPGGRRPDGFRSRDRREGAGGDGAGERRSMDRLVGVSRVGWPVHPAAVLHRSLRSHQPPVSGLRRQRWLHDSRLLEAAVRARWTRALVASGDGSVPRRDGTSRAVDVGGRPLSRGEGRLSGIRCQLVRGRGLRGVRRARACQ